MKLRTRLFLLLSVLSLFLVTLVTAVIYWLTSSALTAEMKEQADQVASRAGAYIDARGQDAVRTLSALSKEQSLRETLAMIASGQLERQSPQVVGLAEKTAAGTGLDVLEIVDREGKVLSSAHWKAYYGKPHPEAVSMALQSGGSALCTIVSTSGRPRVTLASADLLSVGGIDFILFGGYFLDGQALVELQHLLDVDALLIPLAAAGDASAEGSSMSPRSHVTREIPLPHAGGSPTAKLLIGVSRGRLESLAGSLRRAFLYAALSALVVSWAIALLFAGRITRPVERLTAGARRVATGDFSTAIKGEGPDEVGQLVASFNKMVGDLKESQARMARVERIAAWREVARRIAHEIKNALSPIQLSVENVQRSYGKGGGDFEKVLARATATVREEVDGLRSMVDEFSQLARMPAPSLTRHDLREVVERVVSLYERARPSVTVAYSVSSEPLEAMVDPDQLARALSNIVINALEACSDGGRVAVAAGRRDRGGDDEGRWISVEIRDNGSGLDSEQLERIFEPYYTTKKGGTGLGLAIAMKIVSDHGGTIEVKSEPGAGSVFTVLISAAGIEGESHEKGWRRGRIEGADNQ
jgi:two-component system nitrogen regulation sensor histidine kinase NtrY